MNLYFNGIIPPKQWYYNQLINHGDQSLAMSIALYCEEIPDDDLNHDPNLQDNSKCTVAMYLAYRGIIPPK